MQSAADLPLRDIHAAPAPPWWPPAWGWWLLAAAALALLTWALVLLVRWLARRRYRRRLLAEVDHVEAQWRADRDEHRALASLSVLLRRLLVHAGGRTGDAGKTGASWAAVLREAAAGDGDLERVAEAMAAAPYCRQPDVAVADAARLARRWAEAVSRG